MTKIFATAALSLLLAAGGAAAQSGAAGGAATTNPATNGTSGAATTKSGTMKVDPNATGSTTSATNPTTDDCKPGVGTKTESGVTASRDNNPVAACADE